MHRLIRGAWPLGILGMKVRVNVLTIPRCRHSSDDGAKAGGAFQYDEDYHLLLHNTDTKLKQLLNNPARYQPIKNRENRSDIPPSVLETICLGKYISNYRGGLFLREPKELAIFSLTHSQKR